MTTPANRKALRARYEQRHPEAGVYRIVNDATGKALLGSTANLHALRNKLAFARSVNSPGALDGRLQQDIRTFGLAVFTLEVLEVLDTTPEMTRQEIAAGLATLEELWRERFAASELY